MERVRSAKIETPEGCSRPPLDWCRICRGGMQIYVKCTPCTKTSSLRSWLYSWRAIKHLPGSARPNNWPVPSPPPSPQQAHLPVAEHGRTWAREQPPPNPSLNFFFIGARGSVDESRHFAKAWEEQGVEGRAGNALSLKPFDDRSSGIFAEEKGPPPPPPLPPAPCVVRSLHNSPFSWWTAGRPRGRWWIRKRGKIIFAWKQHECC